MTDMRKVIQSEVTSMCLNNAGVDEGCKDIYDSRENEFLMMDCNQLMVMLHVSAY